MKQSILITGGAGYIGSHVACLLAGYNYNIVIVDSYNHAQKFNPSWATLYQADFADQAVLKHIFNKHNISVVIHCAASIEVGHSVTNPAMYYENNVSKTFILLDTMLQAQVKKVIFSSSCAVYGQPQSAILTEEHAHHPLNPYGKTKSIIESVLSDYQQAYGLSYINLRYFNVAGAWPEHGLYEYHIPETHLIPLAIRAALHKTPVKVFGNDYATPDGTALRDFIHVRDIASAHYCALQRLNSNLMADSFNIASSKATSVKQVITSIERMMGVTIPLIYNQRRTGDATCLIGDSSKAKDILQWNTCYSDIDFIISSVLQSPHSAIDQNMHNIHV